MKCFFPGRYAVQLLTPSNLLARINGKSVQYIRAVHTPGHLYDGHSNPTHSKAQSDIFAFNGGPLVTGVLVYYRSPEPPSKSFTSKSCPHQFRALNTPLPPALLNEDLPCRLTVPLPGLLPVSLISLPSLCPWLPGDLPTFLHSLFPVLFSGAKSLESALLRLTIRVIIRKL